MARILVSFWPFPTHLPPFLSVAEALRSRNHDVAFYTASQAPGDAGFKDAKVFPFRHVDWDTVTQAVDRLIKAGGRAQATYWQEFLVSSLPDQLADLRAICKKWQPDAIVCDIAMWAPIVILHEQTGIPVIPLSHVAACILPGPQGSVPGFAMPQKRTVLNRVRKAVLTAAVRVASRPVRRRVNKLRAAEGLPPISTSITEFTGRMPLYLMPSISEFDRQRTDLPSSVQYVGPCLWPPISPNATTAPGEPVVVVEEGGLCTAEPVLLNLALQALAGQGARVKLLLGNNRDAAELKIPAAANIEICRDALVHHLPSAALVASTGNSDSVLTALSFGVPMVIHPGLWDQSDLAWRVAETGVGLRIPPRNRSPKILSEVVARVLREPVFARQARKMQGLMQKSTGPRRAAELIERVVAQTLPHPQRVEQRL